MQVRDWRTGEATGADDFAFSSPTGATEIPLEELRDNIGELPQHFAQGTKQ